MTMTGRVRRGILVAILGCALVVGGVAPMAIAAGPTAAKSKTTTFIGKVPGTDAFIGIVVGKDSARAYVCDSEEIGEWLEGAVAGGTIALESEGGSTFVAEIKGKALRGTLVLGDNRVVGVTAKQAKGKAGLFRKELSIDGEKVLAGWVRLQDGSVRGALRNLIEQLVTPDVTTAPAVGPGVGSTNGVVVIPPPVPPAIAEQVPESPPAAAVVTEAPPLDETVAAVAAPLPPETPPTTFDADACSRINRALAALADELDVLDSDDLRALVFQGTFKRLQGRALFGGCQGVLEL